MRELIDSKLLVHCIVQQIHMHDRDFALIQLEHDGHLLDITYYTYTHNSDGQLYVFM